MSRNARVIGMAVLSAVVFGAVMAFISDDVWAGVIGGAIYGVGMALFMRHIWGSAAFKGLDRRQRRHVMRTMRRGEPIDKPELAGPLVEQANALLAVPYPVTLFRIIFGLTLALGVTTLVLDIAGDDAFEWNGVLLIVLSLVLLFVVLPYNRRQRERIAQSKAATESRWGRNNDPTGSAHSVRSEDNV